MVATRAAQATTLALFVFLLSSCGMEESGTAGSTEAARDPGFCDSALARVDSFMDLPAPTGPTGSEERYGGTVVVGGIGELTGGMNSLVSPSYEGRQHQIYLDLTTLVQRDPDLGLRPYLAEAWELSEDGRELTFRLRDDVYWHDGERTDAHDVAFTFRRATDPATGFPNAAYFRYYEPGDVGVEVLDSLTVRFRMRPHVQPLSPWASLAILPEHLLGDVPATELRTHPYGTVCPVGNGPFVFEEHRPGERWSFTANPHFPPELGGRPYLDRYVFRVVPDQTALLTDLITGGVDVYVRLRPDQAPRVRDAPDLRVIAYPSREYTWVGWNARIPELADPRVRRALTLGTDREQVVEGVLRGYGTVLNSSVLPFHWAYDPEIADALPHDPDRARLLLTEAGWVDRDGDGVRENPAGTPLEIDLEYNTGATIRQEIAEIMQAQLADVGVRIVPRAVDFNTLTSRLMDTDARPVEAVVMGWAVDFRLDDRDIFHSDAADAPLGFTGTNVPEIDHLLDTLPRITDREEARPYWQRYQRLLVEHQPLTFFFHRDFINGVDRRVRGVSMDIRGEWVGMSEWWIPSEERIYQGSSPD